jgi:hypothetical protein
MSATATIQAVLVSAADWRQAEAAHAKAGAELAERRTKIINDARAAGLSASAARKLLDEPMTSADQKGHSPP